MLTPTAKHMLHCFVYGLLVVLGQLCLLTSGPKNTVHITDSGLVVAFVFFALEALQLLALPFALENALGMLLYKAFESDVPLAHPVHQAPFLCFRVVTRGDFPSLVLRNVERNRAICLNAGLQRFRLEVVTDRPIGLPRTSQTTEVLVPTGYRTGSGARYKARALQYCLEEAVSGLADEDWIVHLDEETILTRNAIHGILNFIGQGRHHIGQGLITYAQLGIVNWGTTVSDSVRVADDMGRLRLELKMWHRPLMGWKGSFIVVQAGVERKISFDHGLAGSLLEDNYFSAHASMQGYSFDFVEGEMWEKSPYSVWDFFQQRKRWMQGYYSLAHEASIPFRFRACRMLGFYSIAFVPSILLHKFVTRLYHLESFWLVESISLFTFTTTCYMHVFGVLKSFSVSKIGLPRFLLYLCAGVLTLPFNLLIGFSGTVLALCGHKASFYVVDKGD